QAIEGPPYKGFYPPLDQAAYPVMRQYPVLENTKQVTAIFHDAIRAQNPNSVWLHYHLVGTQFQTVDLRQAAVFPDASADAQVLAVDLRQAQPVFPKSPNDPTGIGQPVFMANLAIETNLGLQFFKGEPPNIVVINNFQNNGQEQHHRDFCQA